MSDIKQVFSRQILDSRGWPTVETEITTSEGVFRASAPSGASTGSHEALELRDGGKNFFGRGVERAVKNVNKIFAPKLEGEDTTQQKHIDSLLIKIDGTKNKSRLGANALLSVSAAASKAGAAVTGLELYKYFSRLSGRNPKIPVPFFNIINGGKHASLKNDIQEHWVIPKKIHNFYEVMRFASEVHHEIGIQMKRRGLNPALVADEGGEVFGKTPEVRLELLDSACRARGYENNFLLGLDCAATEFFSKNKYILGRRRMRALELKKYYARLHLKYGVCCFEDPFAEEDWGAWSDFTSSFGKTAHVIGDDLLVTNPERIRRAVKLRACNALLLKPNQIGTVTEAMGAFTMAKRAGWRVVASHRSGETEDNFIVHLAVGLGCDACKFGAPNRGERTSKYNELLRISERVNYSGVVG